VRKIKSYFFAFEVLSAQTFNSGVLNLSYGPAKG
jgi:hypothetical protein